MKPPICEVCRGPATETVSFADYERLPNGMVGHPNGLGWFCEKHLETARSMSGGTMGELVGFFRRRLWVRLLAAHAAVLAGSAALAIWGHYQGAELRWVVYVFKPLTTLWILALAARPRGLTYSAYRNPIVNGLVFSLAGDVFLMLPWDWFLAGLTSFAVTHVFYILAFKSDVLFASRRTPFVVLGALSIGLVAFLWPGIGSSLRLPVVLYVALLVTMAGQAVARAGLLDTSSAKMAAIGAVLFLSSDATLAWERFGPSFEASRALVLVTYFVGQWLIALSVELYHSER